MFPIVSIIIPCCNAQKYLEQCLDSVILQTFKDIEILCIDDCSTDETNSILKQYTLRDHRVKIISLNGGYGTASLKNLGLKKAKGKYILFFDSGNFLEKDMTEKLYFQAEKTGADITFCGFNCFDDCAEKAQNINWDINQGLLPKQDVFSLKKSAAKLWNLIPPFTENQLYRRKFLIKNKLSFKNIKSFYDTYFTKLAFLLAGKISYVNEKLMYYRINHLSGGINQKSYLDVIRIIYALHSFLSKDKIIKKYQRPFFECALYMMERTLKGVGPKHDLLRSFYLKSLIPKFWGNSQIPNGYPLLLGLDTITDDFKRFFSHDKGHLIPIVFATDKVSAPRLGVTIESIKKNKNYFYDIYVLHEDLSSAMQFNLSGLSEENIRVTCVNVSDMIEKYFHKNFINPLLYRFLIPELFTEYEKILYLDIDVLPQENFEEIFNLDLGKQAVAGIKKDVDEIYVRSILNILPYSFIDSRILLFNVPICQKMNLMKRIAINISLFDQMASPADDITNILFRNGRMILDEKTGSLFDVDTFKQWLCLLEFPVPKCWKLARESSFYETLLCQVQKGEIE